MSFKTELKLTWLTVHLSLNIMPNQIRPRWVLVLLGFNLRLIRQFVVALPTLLERVDEKKTRIFRTGWGITENLVAIVLPSHPGKVTRKGTTVGTQERVL